MSQKPQRIGITWNDGQTKMLRELAERYGNEMRLNDILPYTTSDGDRKPNASGIIYFLMLKETGRLETKPVGSIHDKTSYDNQK